MKSHIQDNLRTTMNIPRKRAAPSTILTGKSIDFQVSTISNQRDHEIYALRNSTRMRRLHQVRNNYIILDLQLIGASLGYTYNATHSEHKDSPHTVATHS